MRQLFWLQTAPIGLLLWLLWLLAACSAVSPLHHINSYGASPSVGNDFGPYDGPAFSVPENEIFG
jgi:hypothetical protein